MRQKRIKLRDLLKKYISIKQPDEKADFLESNGILIERTPSHEDEKDGRR